MLIINTVIAERLCQQASWHTVHEQALTRAERTKHAMQVWVRFRKQLTSYRPRGHRHGFFTHSGGSGGFDCGIPLSSHPSSSDVMLSFRSRSSVPR